MQKRSKPFSRILLSEIRHLVADEPGQDRRRMGAKDNTVQKLAASRSIMGTGDDRAAGLWIDKDIFRKHQNRAPQILLGALSKDHHMAVPNLRLADDRQTARQANGKEKHHGSDRAAE